MLKAGLILILLIPLFTSDAFGELIIEGVEYQTTESTWIVANEISLEEITVEGDGITLQSSATSDPRKYRFYRQDSSTSYNVNFTALAPQEVHFLITSAGINDARLTVTGTTIQRLLLDSIESTDYSWDSSLNTVLINARTLIDIFFTIITGGTPGGGTFTPASPSIKELLTLDFLLNEIIIQQGQQKQDIIELFWESPNKPIVINSVQVESLSNLFTFEQTPLQLTKIDEQDNKAHGKIAFVIRTPNTVCSKQSIETVNCIKPGKYQIPMSITATDGVHEITTTKQITVNIEQTPQLTNYLIYGLMISTVFTTIIIIAKSQSKKKSIKKKFDREKIENIHRFGKTKDGQLLEKVEKIAEKGKTGKFDRDEIEKLESTGKQAKKTLVSRLDEIDKGIQGEKEGSFINRISKTLRQNKKSKGNIINNIKKEQYNSQKEGTAVKRLQENTNKRSFFSRERKSVVNRLKKNKSAGNKEGSAINHINSTSQMKSKGKNNLLKRLKKYI